MTTRKQKFQHLKQKLAELATVDYFVRNITGVVGEVIGRKWPDNTRLTTTLTVGEANQLGGFWQEQWVVTDMAAVFVGRLTRAMVIDSGIQLDADEIHELLTSTEAAEEQAVAQLMPALKANFGDVPVDVVLNNIKRIELVMVASSPNNSIH